jgi:serine-type D-Ala-D-Ala carboxypeptidase (penicillin-binding protein 5/6)
MTLSLPFLVPLIFGGKMIVPIEMTTVLSGVVMDNATGKVLWSRDPDTARFPASTTKIMTCLLMLENLDPNEFITAPADVTKIKEASLNLKPGEKVKVKDMAYALMLRSANDGCYSIAVQMDGSVAAFADRMNKRAVECGATNTHFANPNGLNNPDHTTTAHDLAVIAREAMKREDFRKVVSTKTKVISRSINTKDVSLRNRNKMLWKDETADGIKTGWTIPSGHTYVGSAKRAQTRLLTSLLNSQNWQSDHASMLDWGFKNYENEVFKRAGTVDAVDLGENAPENLKCIIEVKEEIITCPPKKNTDYKVKFIPNEKVSRPYSAETMIGEWSITDADNFTIKVPIWSVTAEPALKPMEKVAATPIIPVALLAIGALGAGTLIVRGKARAEFKANRPF